MKKKNSTTPKDKNDWFAFTKNPGELYNKDIDFNKKRFAEKNVRKLDLHGFKLDNANKKTKEFIEESYNQGFKKLLIVTGKGLRSQAHKDPYRSKEGSILKYSIPDFISNDQNLTNKITRITEANLQDGGDGAIYVFLKNKFR